MFISESLLKNLDSAATAAVRGGVAVVNIQTPFEWLESRLWLLGNEVPYVRFPVGSEYQSMVRMLHIVSAEEGHGHVGLCPRIDWAPVEDHRQVTADMARAERAVYGFQGWAPQ